VAVHAVQLLLRVAENTPTQWPVRRVRGKGMNRVLRTTASAIALFACLSQALALDAGVQAKVDAQVKEIQKWAGDAALVSAVRTQNSAKTEEAKSMTQDTWKALSVMDSFVRRMTQNTAAEFIKSKRTDIVTEAFLSSADGTKVAFLAKPSNWTHKGKPKHDVPMSGKVWQGDVEVDESTGFEQLQVAVPVLDGGKPIGSLVVGLNIGKLKN
jgi:hypothetical protein